jgi:hypothetical protein
MKCNLLFTVSFAVHCLKIGCLKIGQDLQTLLLLDEDLRDTQKRAGAVSLKGRYSTRRKNDWTAISIALASSCVRSFREFTHESEKCGRLPDEESIGCETR